MYKLQFLVCLFSVVLLSSLVALVAAQGSRNKTSKWQTLKGDSPLVIARGGFSGIVPDSGSFAYQLAVQLSLPNVVVWCDVQLTKDGVGICFPDLRLENGSNIDHYFKNGRKTYPVNGVPTPGWFSVDFTFNDLEPVNLKQRIYSRAPNFDGTPQQILTVEDVINFAKPPGLWLNVQHDAFFNQHNLTMRTFIISVSRRVVVNYISSPEVSFLRSIIARFRTSPTKLIFQFLGHDELEPSTNQTYGSLLKNLTFIQTFASGILVPKNYIWPVDNSLYLRPHTSVVSDAHIAGLEVFASTFVNDAPLPYDYSYDPVAEYLNYVDNGNFSVDGVLSDFPITPSEAIDCYSHMGKNEKEQVKLLVISSEGASGDYPGCTDKAYSKAISDGVDVLDCPVQLTNDGIPFCLGSINLRDRTNVDETNFSNLATSNPDLNIDSGIYTYNLTWSQIQSTLRPAIYNPFANYSLFRNTKARKDGNFMQLSDFLAIASNASSVSGVLISIENAAYLAEKQGLGVTDAVLDALSKAGYNQTAKKIMIKSSDSAVLKKFKSSSNYERVYMVDEDISDITNSTILGIKNFANSVVITKKSVFPTDKAFVTTQTNVVPKLQAFGFPVYVQFFRNEFASQPWDFFSDAYVEINTHFSGMGINGTITDFPATAAKYRRSRCLGYKEIPIYMNPVLPGGLISLMTKQSLPPALAPNPILSENDVVEPPLPPVMVKPPPTTNTGNGSIAPGPTPQNGQPTIVASMILSSIAVLATLLLC
ncbi:Glycerophosphodiester phosphodiesterase GDPDL3 [Abeliophyllum distichum]|uniref:glycerophosphodiester phosphodiesterase n=1 Tax=Abeliophyllum distichum TaxID=126358 RepID=A0ABD1PSN1_9LAMI